MHSIVIKEAITKYPVHDLILKRWSPRAFATTPVSQSQLDTILTAASWAPSSGNEQPWRYITALKENEKGFSALLNCLLPSNAVWVKNAPALLLCYTKLTYTKSGKDNVNAFHDAGLANQNLLLQAVSMKIYGHAMEGFDKAKAVHDFKLSSDFQPVCMIALGYLGEAENLDEPYKTRELTPRMRKALDEFVTILR